MEQLRLADIRQNALGLISAVDHGHALSADEMTSLREAAVAERRTCTAALRAEMSQTRSELACDLARGRSASARNTPKSSAYAHHKHPAQSPIAMDASPLFR